MKLMKLRTSTEVVLIDSIRKIFETVGSNAPKGPFGRWCEGECKALLLHDHEVADAIMLFTGPTSSAMIHKVALHNNKTAYYMSDPSFLTLQSSWTRERISR